MSAPRGLPGLVWLVLPFGAVASAMLLLVAPDQVDRPPPAVDDARPIARARSHRTPPSPLAPATSPASSSPGVAPTPPTALRLDGAAFLVDAPLASARLRLVAPDFTREVVTDARGRFAIEVPSRSCELTAPDLPDAGAVVAEAWCLESANEVALRSTLNRCLLRRGRLGGALLWRWPDDDAEGDDLERPDGSTWIRERAGGVIHLRLLREGGALQRSETHFTRAAPPRRDPRARPLQARGSSTRARPGEPRVPAAGE